MTDTPFGRQPLPVTVNISGEDEDIRFWKQKFKLVAENTSAQTVNLTFETFKIYPRAVND